ncbi:MAG: hemolysin family protein [Candidatus Zixiibacteriota bacterium]
MMILLGYIALTAIILLLGYLVSVFSNAVYIDPDEIKEIFPELSERRRRRLQQFIADPRAFFQIGLVVRISGSIFLGVLSMLISLTILELLTIPPYPVYFIILAIIWTLTAIMFIYLPRRQSIEKATAKLVKFLPLMGLIYMAISPFTTRLSRLSRSPQAEVSEDQKDDIVERAIETLAESAGIGSPIIEEDEKEMIHQIFQLDVTEVEEIMMPRIRITGIPSKSTLEKIQSIVAEHGFSRYPVFEESLDDIKGILYVKDLLLLDEDHRKSFNLLEHIREPLVVGEHKKIDDLLSEFRKTKTHMAIVIDEFGGTAGLVTLEDILEEIVGDIEDEHDPEQTKDIQELTNGAFEVDGTYPLWELALKLGIELEQDEFETVGGMIYDQVGSVPSEGTSLTWQQCRIKVLDVNGQRISRVLVVPPHLRS